MYNNYSNQSKKLIEIITSTEDYSMEVIDLCKKNSDLFGNFFIVFLDIFKKDLYKIFLLESKNQLINFQLNNIIDSYLEVLFTELFEVSSKTLITEIHSLKEDSLLPGTDSKERYNYFNEKLLDKKFVIEILEKYPVLSYLIYKIIYNRLDYFKEILNNLCNDAQEIMTVFNIHFKEVEKILVSSGDTHNNGKKVVIIETDGGKIVYKPHSLSPEVIYNRIGNYINYKGNLECPFYTVKTIDKNNYGWQEYIQFKECNSINEVECYYYRIGVALCIFYNIGCSDLHYENIISNGENPSIIDLETLFNNKSINNKVFNEVPNTIANKYITQTVIGTMLLPLNLKYSLFNYDIGGISKRPEKSSGNWRRYVLEFQGTDNVQLVKKNVSNYSDSNNEVKLNSQVVEPINYAYEIQKGFKQCYTFLLENIDVLINIISDKDIIIRQVLRPTGIYSKFLEASNHPKYLSNFSDRYNLFYKMQNENSKKHNAMYKKNTCEIESLMDGDIPYFTTNLYTNKLTSNFTIDIDNFYSEQLIDVVLKMIKNMSKDDLDKQLYYIRMSLATSIKVNSPSIASGKNNNPKYFEKSKQYIECAEEIGALLYTNAVWDSKKEYCTWVAPLIDKNDTLKLGSINQDLYEGGGIILFLALLGKETSNEKYIKLAEAGLKSIDIDLEIQNNKKPFLSAFIGMGSLIYIYYYMYTITGNKESYSKCISYIKKIQQYKFDQFDNIDIVGGISGLIIVLLNIYNKEELEIAKNLSVSLGKNLYDIIQQKKYNSLTGLAHGYAGYAWAIIYLGNTINESKYIELGKELIQLENKHFNDQESNWVDLRQSPNNKGLIFWCHGSPGIALSRYKIMQILKEDNSLLKKDLNTAVNKTITDGFASTLNHSLCHGKFGNMDILLQIGEYLENDELIEIVYKKANETIMDISVNGLKTGLKNGFDMNTFMLGISGIGYMLVRLTNSKYPSILALDL